MPLLRFILPLGALFFGAVAAFMGFMALVIALQSGAITLSHTTAEGVTVTTTIDRVTDPSGYWLRIGLLGGMPIVLGGAAVWWGRKRLFST